MANIYDGADIDATSKSNNITSVTTKKIKPKPLSLIHLIDNYNEPIFKDAIRKTEPKVLLEENINQEENINVNEIPDVTELQNQFNTRALPDHAITYQLEKFKKHAMIIFNHENIDGYEPRIGTIEDEQSLRDTFSKFGFEIEPPHKDLTKVELFDALKNFSEKDFTDYGCVVIVVMTHGGRQGLLRAKDEGQFYSEQDIINHFKTQKKPTLVTKPVILIIQACRGKSSSKGVIVMQKAAIFKDHEEEFTPYYLPVESDMLIFHSSYAGKVSYRPENGSWFIQTLCKQISELHRTHDLESIFTEVKREVAIKKYHIEHNRVTDEMDVKKQMPVVTSTLIRKLYLRRFNDTLSNLPLPVTTKSAGGISTNLVLSHSEDTTCCCYLEHFGYIKTCLSYIVENNPKDEVAKGLLEISKSGTEVNDEKTKSILILISNYLQKHYRGSEWHKYIFFYENKCETDLELHSSKTVTKKWGYWTRSYFVVSLGTCVSAYVIYYLFK